MLTEKENFHSKNTVPYSPDDATDQIAGKNIMFC